VSSRYEKRHEDPVHAGILVTVSNGDPGPEQAASAGHLQRRLVGNFTGDIGWILRGDSRAKHRLGKRLLGRLFERMFGTMSNGASHLNVGGSR